MKLVVGTLVFLLVVVIGLAVLVAHRASWPDCISRVVIVRGPAGRQVECVCFDGALSTCFDPGP
jgi:hypothetical protein